MLRRNFRQFIKRKASGTNDNFKVSLQRLLEGSAYTDMLTCKKNISELHERDADICLTDLTNRNIVKSSNCRNYPIRNLLSQELLAGFNPELAYSAFLQHTKFADTVVRFATDRQQKGLIGPLLDECREVGCVAMFEVGSDKTGLHTKRAHENRETENV